MRLKRSRLIIILISFSITFWLILYWKFLSVYSNHKKRYKARADFLPDDRYPVNDDFIQGETRDGNEIIQTGIQFSNKIMFMFSSQVQ